MRRAVTAGLGIVMAAVLLTPAGAGATAAQERASTRQVSGTVTGPGGFRSEGCDGTITEIGNGTFAARGLGVGTYRFNICISTEVVGFSYQGTASFTTKSGATLNGVVAGTSPTGPPPFTIWVTGGTRRYTDARGILTLGPLSQSNPTNCDPRIGICVDWTDNGPITGTLRGVRHR